MCLPGALMMTAAAFVYGAGGDSPVAKAFLHGIAAGAVGLVTMVLVQLGAKTLREFADYVVAAATAVLVAFLGVPVPYALIGAGAVAIWWHGRRRNTADPK
jgi:chromate transporter